jgi:hypothetical protein
MLATGWQAFFMSFAQSPWSGPKHDMPRNLQDMTRTAQCALRKAQILLKPLDCNFDVDITCAATFD